VDVEPRASAWELAPLARIIGVLDYVVSRDTAFFIRPTFPSEFSSVNISTKTKFRLFQPHTAVDRSRLHPLLAEY
jgi:hypothetical protein